MIFYQEGRRKCLKVECSFCSAYFAWIQGQYQGMYLLTAFALVLTLTEVLFALG